MFLPFIHSYHSRNFFLYIHIFTRISMNTKHHLVLVSVLILVLLSLHSCTKGQSAQHSHSQDSTALAKPVGYTCPMHPNVKSEKEGVCPICQMDLVPENSPEAQEAMTDHSGHDMSSRDSTAHKDHILHELTLKTNTQALADVAVSLATKETVHRMVKAVGTIDFAENAKRTIAARFNGRVERLFVNQSGTLIRKGQALFEVYSPDLVQAQKEYMLALKQLRTNGDGVADTIIAASRKRLALLGLTEEQIQTLERTGVVNTSIVFHAPYSGTVIEKRIIEGTYISEGTTLYDIADLSVVWNIAELYETDVVAVRVGQRVEMQSRLFPGETFSGRVTYIYPVINAEARTVKVRIELANSRGKFRPGMYTETTFMLHHGTGIVVPADAVVVTGKETIVWVQKPDKMNTFEARRVTTGSKFDGKIEILSGVSEGERVVSSGGFLLDSERQLRGGAGGGHNHGGSATPETPQKTSGSMNGMKM